MKKVKTFIKNIFLHIDFTRITGHRQANTQTHIPIQAHARPAFINVKSTVSGHRCMNRGSGFQLQSLNEKAGQTESTRVEKITLTLLSVLPNL